MRVSVYVSLDLLSLAASLFTNVPGYLLVRCTPPPKTESFQFMHQVSKWYSTFNFRLDTLKATLVTRQIIKLVTVRTNRWLDLTDKEMLKHQVYFQAIWLPCASLLYSLKDSTRHEEGNFHLTLTSTSSNWIKESHIDYASTIVSVNKTYWLYFFFFFIFFYSPLFFFFSFSLSVTLLHYLLA